MTFIIDPHRFGSGGVEAYKTVVVGDNPVVFWPIDEGTGTSVADLSGGSHTGTVTGAAWTTGPLDQASALDFDGTDDRITVADFAALDGQSVAMSAWVRAPATSFGAIFSRSDAPAANADQSFLAEITSVGDVRIRRFFGANSTTYTIDVTGVDILDGAWHWVAWRYVHDGTFSVAVDGVNQGSTATSGSVNSSAQPLWVGARDNGAGVTSPWPGDIALAAYWCSGAGILTLAELITHYDASQA